jgi:drug/metabolite transporter (DMT)-like permease
MRGALMTIDSPASMTSPSARPLDAVAISIMLVLCLSWGFNQVAIKVTIADIPPLTQAAIRSFGAALLIAMWVRMRRIPVLKRDGTLVAGIAAGLLFAIEFVLIYRGLLWTTATRAILFLYLTPFFVVIGGRWFLVGESFNLTQWAGLLLSFAGIAVAFGVPTSAIVDRNQMIGDAMLVAAAAAWGATTLIIKGSALNRVSAEKTILYQLVVSGPLLAVSAIAFGERFTSVPSALAFGSLAYQTIWVVGVTFPAWFALIVRYSASRLSVFTFLTPLCGVVAGHLVLNEPLTPPFGAAVAMVSAGLVLVNWPR